MTNSQYIQAIEKRCSRRTYKSKALDDDTVEVVKSLVDIVNKEGSLNFQFVKDGTDAFTLISGKFSIIAVCAPDTEKDRIKCGYYGETIVLQCAYHGLGTCWVSGTYNENKIYEMIDLPDKIRLYGVIVVGYVKEKFSQKEKIMYNITHKQDKPYQKMIVACDEKLPVYYEYAMKMVGKAPSSSNSKPVHFRYENGIMSATVDEPYSINSVDLGIARLHFQLGAAAKGLKGQWDFNGRFCSVDNKVIKFPENEKMRSDIDNGSNDE